MQVAQVDFAYGDAPALFTRGEEELAGDRFAYISFLLSQWSAHGQHVSDGFPFVRTPQGRRAWLLVPDVDSLAPEHDNQPATKHRQQLSDVNVSIKVQMLGEDQDRDARLSRLPCRCSGRSSLILFARFYSLESPLRCGDCFGVVPLYQIPTEAGRYYEPHDDLRAWVNNYNACDTLNLGSRLAEKWALRQMGRPRSKLSKEGRRLCRRLEKLMGVPVFYYLHRYYGRSWKKEEARKCPRCKGKWRLKEQWHNEFDFRCDRCRLLSNIAMQIGN